MQGLNRNPHLLPGEFEWGREYPSDADCAMAKQLFDLDPDEMRTLEGYGITLGDILANPFQAVRDLHQEIEELGGMPPEGATGLAALIGLYLDIVASALRKLERIPLAMH